MKSSAVEPALTPATLQSSTIPGWQRSLTDSVKSLSELLQILDLKQHDVDATAAAQGDFPLRVPRGFVHRMRTKDPQDPLLLQVLPIARELQTIPGYTQDPLAEERATVVPGLLHKYHGRALLIATGACAIHCRYCFRRHFPYSDHQSWGDGWSDALAYIGQETSLTEVILSGGDPLSVNDQKLAELASALGSISHLRRLRIHTRMPVVLPDRVDDNLLAWLSASRLEKVIVIHANHRNEIDGRVASAIGRLRVAGVTVLNQTVLLAGINDDSKALIDLSEALFEAGALPYYLNLLDPVQGAAHFEVDETRARRLVWEVMQKLPGYLVPRLVREIAEAPCKMPVSPLTF